MDNALMTKQKNKNKKNKKKSHQLRAKQRPDPKQGRQPASTRAANAPEPWDSAVNSSPPASGAAYAATVRPPERRPSVRALSVRSCPVSRTSGECPPTNDG
jgi:hypothetical protein